MDELTRLPTTHDLPIVLTGLLARSGEAEISAVFLDIDALNRLVYSAGWREADGALARLGAWLQAQAAVFRGHAFRIGGDEFLLLLPDADTDSATTAAGLLVDRCAALRIPCSGEGREVLTMSAVAFRISPEMATGIRDLRERLAHAIYTRKRSENRRFGVVTTL